MPSLGIILALGALIGFGVGDYAIQKTTRAVGDVPALFYIALFGSLVMFPFALPSLSSLALPSVLLLLVLATVVTFFSSLFDFEALKQGKIAIVEPIIGLELPIVIALSVGLHGERLSGLQWIAMSVVFVGVMLCATKGRRTTSLRGPTFERGVIFAGLGAISLAVYTFLIGVSSQVTSPLLTLWFVFTGVAFLCFLLLAWQRRLGMLAINLRTHFPLIAAESILDMGGWICFAMASTRLPISMVTTISESYVGLAVILGLVLGKERVQRHQLAGAALAAIGVIVLARFA